MAVQRATISRAADRGELRIGGCGSTAARAALAVLGAELLPKGLYARALIIIIAPIVVLEGVIAFVFMERHWQEVTRRLSEATARDIAALDRHLRGLRRQATSTQRLIEMARDRLNLSMQILPPGDLPAPRPKPFFALLDRALSDEISQARQAAVLDRHRRPVAPRRDPRQARRRHPALRRHAHPDLRLELAHLPAVDGRLVGHPADRRDPVPAQPDPADPAARRGRRRLRQGPRRAGRFPAARRARGAPGRAGLPRDARPHQAHVEQRTTMLAGVSHDLRTVLTRFKLELALLGDTPETRVALEPTSTRCSTCSRTISRSPRATAARRPSRRTCSELLEEIHDEAQIYGTPIELKMRKRRDDLVLPLKRQAFKRAITNLVIERRALRRPDRHPRRDRRPMAAHRGRRQRPGHPAIRARQRVQAVLPARPRAQPGRGQHRPRPRHRPRHRQEPRRRHHARRKLDGRPPRHHLGAAVDTSIEASAAHVTEL